MSLLRHSNAHQLFDAHALFLSGCCSQSASPCSPTVSHCTRDRFLCLAAALNLKQYSGRYGGKWCANPYDVPLPEGTPLNRTSCPQTAVTVPQITPVCITCPALLCCRPLTMT